MQFINELYQFLQKQGFGLLDRENTNIWGKQEEKILYLLEIIPERLPGQDSIDLEKVMQEQENIGRHWMIKTGLRIEWFTWMLFRGEPGERDVLQLETWENVWGISYEQSRIYLYEKQKGDYCDLKNPLEDFLYSYKEAEKNERKLELKSIFTPINTTLIAINVLVFLILSILGNTESAAFMAEHGAMVKSKIIEQGQWYLLFTAMFVHFGEDHLLQNMIILMVTGSRLERVTGKWKFLLIYIISGLVSSAASLLVTMQGNDYIVSGGASGAIFGVMGALLGMILKDLLTKKRRRIKDIGIAGIVFIIGSALFYGFVETGVDNAAHVGGLLAGVILSMIIA